MGQSTSGTRASLKDRPNLGKLLRGLWLALALYLLGTFAMVMPARAQELLGVAPEVEQAFAEAGANLSIIIIYDIFLDFLFLGGFVAIAALLFRSKPDDLTSLAAGASLMAFGGRITSTINSAALMPEYVFFAGAVLALGDIGIVGLNLFFPDGRATPRWTRWLLPLLFVHLMLLYVLPFSPIYWGKLSIPLYLANVLPWYHLGITSTIYRYLKVATPLQRQQIRWFFWGSIGPLVWFLLFNVLRLLLPGWLENSINERIFDLSVRSLGIVLFLSLPASIAVAIARYRLFEVDWLINRSLVYGVVTLALGGLFGLALGLVSLVFRNFQQGQQYGLALTASAVLAGLLFQPLRRRAQRFVDRYFYHIQIPYDRTPAPPLAPVTGMTEAIRQTRFASYRSLSLIGRGGMAEVYRAEHPTLGKPVAIKVLPAARAEDETFRKRFQREAEMIARLQHPNIVRLYDYGDEQGLYYMVMEYLSGPDLSAYLRQAGRLKLEQARPLLAQTAAALDYAHAAGLVHRDIKPSNILLDESSGQQRAVLSDFGIARQSNAQTQLTNTGVLGTFDYIAPEQIQAAPDIDGRADIYAFGILSYQLLTGQLPYQRANAGALILAHLTALPPNARELAPELSPVAAAAIQRAMAKAPADRYPTAGEFVADLI